MIVTVHGTSALLQFVVVVFLLLLLLVLRCHMHSLLLESMPLLSVLTLAVDPSGTVHECHVITCAMEHWRRLALVI